MVEDLEASESGMLLPDPRRWAVAMTVGQTDTSSLCLLPPASL